MFLRLLSAILLQSAYGSVSDCSNGLSLFRLTSMSFSPDPPVKGGNSTLLLSMDVPVEVTSGTATYSVTYNFIPLTPTIKNLCTELPSGCPIRVGSLDTVSSFPFDGSLSGSLNMKIEWKSLATPVPDNLLCVAIKTKL